VLRDHIRYEERTCKGLDPEIFYPVNYVEEIYELDVLAAQAICRYCVVKEACYREGLEVGRGYGIWGGVDLTADARAQRREKRIAKATNAAS